MNHTAIVLALTSLLLISCGEDRLRRPAGSNARDGGVSTADAEGDLCTERFARGQCNSQLPDCLEAGVYTTTECWNFYANCLYGVWVSEAACYQDQGQDELAARAVCCAECSYSRGTCIAEEGSNCEATATSCRVSCAGTIGACELDDAM